MVLLASGAGVPAANGRYVEDGKYGGCPKFVHQDGQLWLLRYKMPSGRYFWYIADKDRLEDDAGDLYRIQSSAITPPLDCPWTAFSDGVPPGPVLAEIGAAGVELVHEVGEAARSQQDYRSVDAISAILRSGDIALIKASYLLELSRTNATLPRRQDLPPGALVSGQMLERLLDELAFASGCRRQHEMLFTGLVVVSYAWAARGHPDPAGI